MIVKLDKIAIDAGTQARASINTDTVNEYAERMVEGDKFPPVILFHDGNQYYVGDGFHRILGAEHNGFDRIEADIHKGTRDDALWFALGANSTNGQRMSKNDLRHAVEIALKTWPEKTQTEIAEQIGCSQFMVHTVQKELIGKNKLTIPETRVGRDGKERPTTYRKQEESIATVDDDTPEFVEPEEGEQKGEGEDMHTDVNIQKRVKIYKAIAPCCGVQYARIAISKLNEITEDDQEKQEAINMVKGWIDAQR